MLIAVLDACVLYSAPLRDFFMRLAVRLYQPKWTDAIHEEWIRNVLNNRSDISRANLTRTRALMDLHGGDCLVRDYDTLSLTLSLPDVDDRHVLAAAIISHAPLIVTFNLSDFPCNILSAHNIRAIHPDDFAMMLYHSNPNEFVKLVRLHRLALKDPPKTVYEYLETLSTCGLRKTVVILQNHNKDI